MSSTLSPELQRLNYDVLFEAQSQIQMSKETWIYTFEVQLPEQLNMIRLSGCNQDIKTCSVVNDVLLEVNQIRQETELFFNYTIETIENLVPERNNILKSRTKRSILPFIGDLSKSLFGTATVEDVQLLAKHINALNRLTDNVVKSVQQHEDHLSSYIQTVDDRFTNIVKGIKENELAITHIHTQLYETFDNLERSFTTMSVLMSKQIEKSGKLESVFQELLEGIFDLVKGKLSPHLIPPKIILQCIRDIQNILHDKFSGFHLIHTNPKEIYKNVQSIYPRKGPKLFISVKFPISPFPAPLTLYKVLSFPVPMNETSKHATHLVDLPEFIALTNDMQYYVILTPTDLSKCENSRVQWCKFNKVLTPITHTSCILALFKNDKNQVKQHCDFRVSLNHIQKRIVYISHTSILVYGINLLELDCKDGQRMIQGCKFCIIEIPCECSVSTTEMYLPPRLSACHINTTSKVHPVNLALLQQFFNDSSLQSIDGNSLFETPLKSSTPNFQVYKHNIHDVIADDRKGHLSLEKMAEAARNESVIFRSLTEPLLSGDISIDQSWPTTDKIILYATAAVAIFSLIAFIVTFLKLRKVLVILTVLQNVNINKANASTLPSLVYKNDNTTPAPTELFFKIDLTIDHYILAMCILILLFLVSKLIYKYKNKCSKTVLLAELTNGETCVHIPLRAMSLCPNYWNINVPKEVSIISIQGLVSPIVYFEWDQFDMTNKLTGTKMQVKNHFSISMLKGRKVRQILATTYCVYFYVKHENLLLPIS